MYPSYYNITEIEPARNYFCISIREFFHIISKMVSYEHMTNQTLFPTLISIISDWNKPTKKLITYTNSNIDLLGLDCNVDNISDFYL